MTLYALYNTYAFFFFFFGVCVQSVQATFMAEEWVDHSLDMARDAKNKLEATERAHADTDKKLKETLAQIVKVEKAHREFWVCP